MPEIDRQPEQGKQVVFRAGSSGHPALAKPEVYKALEEPGVKYAVRIPANDSLERDVAELRTRPGSKGAPRPSPKPVARYKSFL